MGARDSQDMHFKKNDTDRTENLEERKRKKLRKV
jgi:hypothetical protein